MKNFTWHFPEKMDEAVALVTSGRVKLHAGGTHLAGKSFKPGDEVVALDKLPLKYVKKEGQAIKIGSMTDYATVVQKLEALAPGHLLARALGRSATLPLRNRITIGGSLNLAPNWSDLTGPLLALDAQVALEGDIRGTFPVADYLSDNVLRKNSLIVEIILPVKSCNSWYYRETTIESDYPAFTLSVCANLDGSVVKDIAIAITGHTKRFMRAYSIEQQLKNQDVASLNIREGIGNPDLRFASSGKFSSDYLKHCAITQLERGLKQLLKS